MYKTFSAVAVCSLSLLLTSAVSNAQSRTGKPITISNPTVHRATRFDISKPLRELMKIQSVAPGEEEDHGVLLPKGDLQTGLTAVGRPTVSDPVLQSHAATPTAATIGLNLLGVGKGFHSYTVPDAPTDSNLSVGDTQVLEWVNTSYAVFNKTTGAYEAGPILGNALWSGFGGECQTQNSGDIVAQWDKVAHRWVLHQPLFTSPYGACFAISTTNDALGTYYRYYFPITQGFPDYPKLGIWTDATGTVSGYFQTNNMFNNALTAYIGAMPCAYDRNKMLAGDPTASQVCILDNSNGTLFDDSMIPGDIDSENSLPPTGTDEVLLGSIDNFSTGTAVYEYVFHVDFVTPANSTLTGTSGSMPITVPAFVGTCNFGSSGCIPEPGVSAGADYLDSLGDRLMYRLAYRRLPGPSVFAPNIQSWVISHSIVSGASAAMRWYEFRSPIASPTALALYQSGTYAPDASWRFMGSLAMDKVGNILLGYSTSSTTVYPSINFAGRASADPLGTLGAEGTILTGTGSQQGTSHRWGDYSNMAIDNDGCTFWYVNQFYTVTGTFGWSTQLASLKFPNCH